MWDGPLDWRDLLARPAAAGADPRLRLRLIGAGFVFSAAIVFLRVVQLELGYGEAYRTAAATPLQRERELPGVRGRIREATLRPGYYAQDGLVFQPPPAKVRHLRLELAGEAVGLPEPFRFHIPRELIHSGETW